MKHKLIMRPRADIDLAKHFLYLSEHNPQAALRFDKAVARALKKIESDPQLGARLNLPRVDHLGMRFYRPKGFKNYLILFRLVEECIYISRILHGSQDVESALLD